MAHRGAAAAGALVAVSPLLWDTESLGLADLPLATLATLAVLLAVIARRKLGSPGHHLAGLLAAGVALGGLPWIKQEGWPLGVWLLLAAGLLVVWGFEADSGPRSGRWAGLGGRAGQWQSLALLVGPCAALWGLQPLVHAPLTAPATGFLSGRWTERVVEHLPELPTILGHMAVDLLRWDWCLLWALFALASFLAVRNRHRRYRLPAILGGVVLAQLGVYTFIYLATYLDPAAHILSSFVRIAAALVPLAAITAFLVLAPTDS